MSDIPISLYSEEQLRRLEQLAIVKDGGSGYQLMCRAGQAALEVLLQEWPDVESIAVCIGTGNNGGDGLVLARLAKARALGVHVYQVGEISEERLSAEAKQARHDWLQMGGEIQAFSSQPLQGEIIVDALLGIGVKSPLAKAFQTAIEAINQSGHPIFSIDLPSGLDPNTGNGLEAVVEATATITFIALKVGMVTGQAIDKIGNLYFDHLGISAQSYVEIVPIAHRLIYQQIMRSLPKRSLSSHKGDHGHVCIVGAGDPGYAGAVCLAGAAALRAGAGLVSAVVAPQSIPLMARAPMELMVHGLSELTQLFPLLAKATAVILGPGLGENAWAEQFFKAALTSNQPMVVDADGLNWLAKNPQKRTHWILTPHPKEAARLLAMTTQEIQNDRLSAARKLAAKYGGVIVLKGAGTIIIDEQQQITIQDGGYPILGTAGTGDVLAGLIGSLVAQGVSLGMAAKIGVSVHTCAAQLEQTLGDRGMLASDLFPHIHSLINTYE